MFLRAACCIVTLSPAVILPPADDRTTTSTFSCWINRRSASSVAGANHLLLAAGCLGLVRSAPVAAADAVLLGMVARNT